MNTQNSRHNSQDEATRRQARRVGILYSNLLLYLLIIAGLFGVNLLTHPRYLWAAWPALGLGIAISVQAWHVFVTSRFTR